MELNFTITSLFLFQLLLCTKLYLLQQDDNINSATRPQHVQSLVTHHITDKAAYLSEATK